jgi:exonuclease SbcC
VPYAPAVRRWEATLAQIERHARACDAARRDVDRSWVDTYAPPATADAHQSALLAQQVRRDADELDTAAARYERIVAAVASNDAARRQHEAAQRRLVGLRAEAEARSARLDDVTARLAELDKAPAELQRLEHLESELTTALHRAEQRARAGLDLTHLEAERSGRDCGVDAAQQRLAAVRSAWRAGLAGRLAQSLADGHPCPTCGSTAHPAPAAAPVVAPDDEEVAQAERALATATQARDRLAVEHARLVGQIEALGAVTPGNDPTSLRDALGRTAADRVTAAEALRQRSSLATERNQIDAQVAADRARIDRETLALVADRARLEAHADQADLARAEFEAQFGQFCSPTPLATARHAFADALGRLGEAQDALASALSERDQLLAVLAVPLRLSAADDPATLCRWLMEPAEIDRIQAGLDGRASRRSQVRDRLAAYVDDGGPTDRPVTEPLHLEAKKAAERHLDLVSRQAVIEEQVSLVDAGPARLERAAAAVSEARRSLEAARTLADRCAGTATGPGIQRLSLENWVLADYLRHVLVQANARLEVMTTGRFTLHLADGVTDGRKQWGLDLSVFDVHTGQTRPVTTLSGGETFMAALALALGLADVVSGGSNRRIGALFIDEGFGYLDPRALDGVIDVLRSLEDGGRIVGVISHVEEITRALPTGIAVAGTPSGSSAEIRYPPD